MNRRKVGVCYIVQWSPSKGYGHGGNHILRASSILPVGIVMWTLQGCIFRLFCCCMMLTKVSTMSVHANIMPAFEPTKGGIQFYEGSKRASRLLSESCTVQVLLRLGNLPTLRNTGISAFQRFWLYTNTFGTKQSVCIYHRWLVFRESVRRCFTVDVCYWGESLSGVPP